MTGNRLHSQGFLEHPPRFMRVTPIVILTFAALRAAVAQPSLATTFSETDIQFFKDHVKPILAENCFKCHGGVDKRGKIRIRSEFQVISRRGILKGGSLGPAYNAASPSDSLLLKMLSYKDEEHQMPPSGKLEEGQIATLTAWVEKGLPWTAEDANKLIEVEEGHGGKDPTRISDYTKGYWSYKPMIRPEVPEVDDPNWSANPIDAFIYHKLKQQGLKPNGLAPARTLVRRAYYNITGLPPSPEEMEAWAKDFTPSKWRELIDVLLEKPQYGEKWARHWLDVVRFAESNGFERDSVKEEIWRYRDYVINSLNEDKPYDRFIEEQLAGDELDDVTAESLIATGYHRLMQWDDEPSDRLQYRYDVLDDNVRITSEGFLGMTLGCARCHDHKGDPISQKDYYSFMAFFHGVTQMDKRRVIQNIDVAMPEAVRKRRQAEMEEQIEMVASQIRGLEAVAKEKLAEIAPEIVEEPALTTAANSVLVSKGKRWQHTIQKPAEDWYTVGFRPQDWKLAPAPFGRHRDAKTHWDKPAIWMQTTFGLTALPSGLHLEIFHDDDVEVYLNGQLIFEAEGPIGNYKTIPLESDAVAALQTGRNVVAVHCRQESGGQFIDLALHGDYGGEKLAKLIKRHRGKVFTSVQFRNYKEWHRQLASLREKASQLGIKAMIVQEHNAHPEPMFVHLRGSAHAHGDPVDPDFPAIFAATKPQFPKPKQNAKSSGRRRVLAEWITQKDNPRTARVAMNRLWQHHFGRGLCPTPNDFGFLGEKPMHPELLDWLATELVQQGWSLKTMHRLIMTSRTYQMASSNNPLAMEKDPQNNYWWRFDQRRLSAEEIRDAMLAVSGELNLKIGGPSFYPTLPPEVLATSSTGAGKWGKSSPEEERRRSVYIKIKRSLKPPELVDFDFADTDSTCAARFVTTVPTQALMMMNSKAVNDHARKLADRLRREHDGDARRQVKRGLELTCGRPVAEAEIERCLEMIDTFESEHQLTPDQALERFCLLALNLNEFVYLD